MQTKLIHSIIEAHALKNPKHPALIMDNSALGYEQFVLQAKLLAQYLQQLQLQNERVALHFDNSIKFAIIYLGCFMAGVVAVPLNIGLKKEEILYILEKTSPKLLIAESIEHPELQKIYFSQTSIKQIVTLKELDPLLETNPYLAPLKIPDENSALAIFFTSGSTAKPKGVVHSQRSFVAMLDTMVDAADINFEQRFLVFESMSNASGCIHAFMAPFVGGASILTRDYNLAQFRESLKSHPVCTAIMGKANYDIVQDPTFSPNQFKGMAFNFSGGDKITADLMQRFKEKTGIPIRLGYGMSEFLIFTVNKSLDLEKQTSVGTVAKGVKIELRDQNGEPVNPGEIGEVWAYGPNCMLGYWEDLATTQEAIVDGWLRTGDLARMDSDGFYWFMGRLKHIIIREGANISPLEVEEVLSEHPAVHAAAVIGIPDENEGEVPMAFVELNPDSKVSAQELITFAQKRLEDYKVPVAIKIVDRLPRTMSGKISRKSLKETH